MSEVLLVTSYTVDVGGCVVNTSAGDVGAGEEATGYGFVTELLTNVDVAAGGDAMSDDVVARIELKLGETEDARRLVVCEELDIVDTEGKVPRDCD